MAIPNGWVYGDCGCCCTTTYPCDVVPQVEDPVFDPESGVYPGEISVTITTETVGAAIYYTTDGSIPTESSTLYTGPITVSETETIRAVAILTGLSNSNVITAVYTISAAPAVENPIFDPPAGTYEGEQLIEITTGTGGASIYYTTDGSTPTTSSTLYTGAITVSVTTTIKAIAVLVGFTDSAVVSAAYTITPVTTVAAPVFHYDKSNPQTYLFSDEVGFPNIVNWSITCATAGADIYWLSGSDTAFTPDINPPSAIYTGPGAISTSYQFKAIGYKAGVYSTVTTSTFAIELPVFWGYSANTTLSGVETRALQDSQLRYNWTATIPAFVYGIASGTYTFDSGSTVFDYFYWAWPQSYPSPTVTNGFFLTPFPVDMAGPAEGYTDGPENGWYYQLITVDTGITYKVYRTLNQVGGGGSTNITVQ